MHPEAVAILKTEDTLKVLDICYFSNNGGRDTVKAYVVDKRAYYKVEIRDIDGQYDDYFIPEDSIIFEDVWKATPQKSL